MLVIIAPPPLVSITTCNNRNVLRHSTPRKRTWYTWWHIMTCRSDLPYLVSDFSGDWMITRKSCQGCWFIPLTHDSCQLICIYFKYRLEIYSQHHLLYYLGDVHVSLAESFLPDDCENICTPSYYNYQKLMLWVGSWIKSGLYALPFPKFLLTGASKELLFIVELLDSLHQSSW